MSKLKHLLLIVPFFLLLCLQSLAQQNDDLLKKFEELATSSSPGLNETVNISVPNSSLQAFLSGLGKAHNLNIIADPNLKIPISLSFTNEPVKNVLIYLVNQHRLKVDFTGSIMSFTKQNERQQQIEDNNLPVVIYDKKTDKLSFDINEIKLKDAIKVFIEKSDKNIVMMPGTADLIVSGFIKNMDFELAVSKFATMNGLELDKDDENIYYLKKPAVKATETSTQNSKPRNGTSSNTSYNLPSGLSISAEAFGNNQLISIQAEQVDINQILKGIFRETASDYFVFEAPNQTISLQAEDILLDELLTLLLSGTDFTFHQSESVYLIGNRQREGFRNTIVHPLEYRSVKEINALIPNEIQNNVIITEFPELNSLILSGSSLAISEIQTFVREIDKPVPVVLIELLIIDVKKTKGLSTGISAGLADEEVQSGGTLLPGIDVTLGSGALNDILDNLGLMSIGNVTPEFYVSLQALENNGFIDIRSTPRLSTLNGHKASINIGQTDYYLEQNQNIYNNQNTQTVITNQYKAVNADFTVSIDPIVSGNEHVTLEVAVDQSDFTARIAPDAPPGTASRKFESIIRVKNEEMIILGGLERNAKTESATGIPFLARIPIIKWFFSSREKSRENSKLLIFIKPSVIY